MTLRWGEVSRRRGGEGRRVWMVGGRGGEGRRE